MSTSEFDKQLQEQYDQGGFDYNPAAWQHMLQQLDTAQPAKSRKPFAWLPYTGMAASVALIVMLSYFFYTRPGHTGASVVTTAPQAQQKTALPATPETTATEAAPASNTPSVTYNSGPATHSSRKNTTVPAAPGNIPAPAQTTEQLPLQQEHPRQEDKPAIAGAPTTAPDIKKTVDRSAYMPDYILEDKKGKEINRTSLNLAGGVNYGSLNTGYTLAVNARRTIGNKFYVEGDLAFVNNNPQNAAGLSPQQYTVVSNGGFANGIASVQAANPNTSVNTLSYLQFAPSVGYRLLPKLSVGAGADVQRMLQNNDTKTVIDANGSVKLVPDVDFGLTAKTEYAITPRLNTGIMYREGLNGLADSKYLNRRYIQMQLKWRLFEK